MFYRFKIQEAALQSLKARYPKLNIGFSIDDRKLLFSFIKKHDLELTAFIEKFKAISIMLHNISFALFLFAILQVAWMIISQEFPFRLIGIIATFFFSFLALGRSALYNRWYFDEVFEQALHYGRNIPEMFKKEWATSPHVKKSRNKRNNRSKNDVTN